MLFDHEGINLEFYKNDFNAWDKEKEIAYNNNEIRQKQKHHFYQNAFDFITDNKICGDYFEFGVHRARTFRMALSQAATKNINEMKFYAFDSFEGLPNNDEIKNSSYLGVTLKSEEWEFDKIISNHGLYLNEIIKIKGWYDSILTEGGAVQNKLINNNVKVSLITLDCDLYYSSSCALNFIRPFIQDGTVLYLDDWNGGFRGSPNKGMKKAFYEFKQKYYDELHFEDFLSVGWFGKSFIINIKE